MNPIITFNLYRSTVYINTACLREFTNLEYAQFLISAPEKQLKLRLCGENNRDSVRLRSAGNNRFAPRHIRCYNEFLNELVLLTKWNQKCRYKLIGCVEINGDETNLVFNLNLAEEIILHEKT